MTSSSEISLQIIKELEPHAQQNGIVRLVLSYLYFVIPSNRCCVLFPETQ